MRIIDISELWTRPSSRYHQYRWRARPINMQINLVGGDRPSVGQSIGVVGHAGTDSVRLLFLI